MSRIHYNLILNGGSLQVKDVKDILHKSYEKDLNDSGDFQIDRSLSGQRAKVYHNPKTGQTVVAHKGTQGIHDWITDGAYFTTGYKSNRFKHAEKIQKQAEEKYGKENVSTIGHSLGAELTKTYGNNSKEMIAYNRPIAPSEVFTKKSNKLTDIRTTNDPVSLLSPLTTKNGKEVSINSKTYHPLAEHKVKNLEMLDQNMVVGEGVKRRRGRPRKH